MPTRGVKKSSDPMEIARVGLIITLALLVAGAVGSAAPAMAEDRYDHIRLGRLALEKGDKGEACRQFCQALAYEPHSRKILKQLLTLCADDPDARTLWSHAWYASAADVEGRVRPDKKIEELLQDDDSHLQKIAFARARAVAELAAFARERTKNAGRDPDELLVACWARRLALDLARQSPALEKGPAQRLDPTLAVTSRFFTPVIKALEILLKTALSNERTETAVRAARILHGLGVQAGFKDLKGPRPSGMERVRSVGAAGMARAREQLRRRIGEPWTVNELEWLEEAEGEAFTRDHASFARPAVALSPKGRYRIETDCGYATLLGVARTIEDHHARLARWFGQDPFEKRQGIVRIVPEAHGLESEGAPFWWAGGMQGGDTTTMRFACGTIEGLGHGLTHELTHRFDGALYPGMPLWLVEGRAVWTGAAYGTSRDLDFVPNHCSFGTIEATFIKGYGGEKKLTELIEQKLDDYRDNYVAGYALYVYLNTWEEEGKKIYAERLHKFMEKAPSGRRNPKAFFVKHFADGKEGRPDGLKEFAARFHTFIRGFYWKTRQPWTKRYTQKVPAGSGDGYVYDEPTWTWSRNRAEPWFGEDHGREAGFLFADLGRKTEAIRAFIWGLSVDGRFPRAEEALGAVLAKAGRKDAAWVLEQTNLFPFERCEKPAPFGFYLRQTKQLARALEEAAADYRQSGRHGAAQALEADRNRLAAWLGLEPPEKNGAPHTGTISPESSNEGPLREMLHPFDQDQRYAGLSGWDEADLSGYEEFRVKNLWFAAENGDLHVGRKKPRKGTGLIDRNARRAHCFALSKNWTLPGAYRIKTRIKFTTSYVSGAVVFGYTRRDHNLRFQFNAGDLMYAIGESDEEPTFKSVGWRLHGLRTRDGALPGSVSGGGHEFDRALRAFDLELLVEGAAVQAFINGQRVGTYHTVDGAAIEGRLGFASSYGAYVAQKPIVERIDRARLAPHRRSADLFGRAERPPLGLELSNPRALPFADLQNLPLFGLRRASNGTLLLWIPMPWLGGGDEYDPEWVVSQAHRAASQTADVLRRERVPQRFVLALPAALGAERIAALKKALGEEVDNPPEIVTHAIPGWTAETDGTAPDQYKRWVLFVDSLNIIRCLLPYVILHDAEFNDQLDHWMTVFRDHGRPERDLPTYTRGENSADEE